MRASALALLCLLVAAWPTTASGPRFDYSLAVEILPGREYSDARLRREIGRALVARLAESACYERVALVARDADDDETPLEQELLLQLYVDGIELLTEYGTSQASQADPDRLPEMAQRRVATVEVLYGLRLATAEGDALRERFGMRQTSSYRPRHTEDPAAVARANALFDVARSAGRFACKGSAKKLERAIAEAAAAR